MKRILIPTSGPGHWRERLGDPEKHWKRGRSALELAVSWERAQSSHNDRGLPIEVAAAIDSAPQLTGATLLLGIPEHKVTLNNGLAPSQNDLWALLQNERGLISLAVEGKAGEPFDKTVTDWLHQDDNAQGRIARLAWLCEWLHSPNDEAVHGNLRYQLFHRTVSALKEAQRCRAFAVVMLVQAFPGAEASWDDLAAFVTYLGTAVKKEHLVQVPGHENPQLFLGWASSKCANDAQIVAAVLDE